MRRDCWSCAPADRRNSKITAFAICPNLLRAGDRLVVNDTRVIAAQLSGRRLGREPETNVSVTLIKRLDGSHWRALAKPAKRLAQGDVIRFGAEGKVCFINELDATVAEKGEAGEITLAFSFHGPVLDQAIAEHGAMPLPPYIAGKRKADERDDDDYQTMFAKAEGAVAAPTAGLHFTDTLTAHLRERGIDLTTLTLHVGAGTFLRVEDGRYGGTQDARRVGDDLRRSRARR